MFSDNNGNFLKQGLITSFISDFQAVTREINFVRSLHLNSSLLKEKIKTSIRIYFENIRPELLSHNIGTDELDQEMQELLSLTNVRTRIQIVKRTTSDILSFLRSLEAQQIIKASDKIVESKKVIRAKIISTQDKQIIDTLNQIALTASFSYQQAVDDLSNKRISYRGTASELREVLREVLDSLAPDKEVMAIPGFKLEDDKKTPTMVQKVRFILKNRYVPKSAIEVPEQATTIIEESIAKLTRATYSRGSITVHVGAERNEVLNLKRYVDSVLCEILEIH